MDEQKYLEDKISIWEGLENFRQVLKNFYNLGLKQINQNYLDRSFSSYGFRHIAGFQHNFSKSKLLEMLEKERISLEKKSLQNRELLEEIALQKQFLENIQEELCLEKISEKFKYEIVVREENLHKALTGFVKITRRDNPQHVALLSWQDSKEPILFLAEREPDGKLVFHVNFNEGLVLIEEKSNYYFWTQWTECEFTNLLNKTRQGAFGLVKMSKLTGEFSIEKENSISANALSKANTPGSNGKSLLENNVELMSLYKTELERLADIMSR